MDQSHFFRNVQPLGLVGRSPVQDHDEEIIRVIVPDLIQKAVHALRVHFFSAVMESSAPSWGLTAAYS